MMSARAPAATGQDLGSARATRAENEPDRVIERQSFGPRPSTNPEAHLTSSDIEPHVANSRAELPFRLLKPVIFIPDRRNPRSNICHEPALLSYDFRRDVRAIKDSPNYKRIAICGRVTE